MLDCSPVAEPCRPADLARLELTRLRIEDGVTFETVIQKATEVAARVLEVERVGVWLLVNERQSLRCVDLFERRSGVHSSGATLQTAEFPEYFSALENRKTVPAEVAVTDPRTSKLTEAYLAPLGITSVLDASIYVGGRVVGVLCHEHIGTPREWTTEQRDFAGSLADLLALKIRAVEAVELRAALRTQAAQLLEAQRVAGLAETVAGVAHDFNNVLGAMIGLADVVAQDGSCPSALAELAKQIVTAGQRGAGLARVFIDFARPRPRESRVVQPAAVLEHQLALLRAAAGGRHTVSLDLRSSGGRVLIDPQELERVVLNLVVNARDAMPDGGPIEVTVDAVAELDGGGKPCQFALVVVSDRGTGIPPHVLDHIFDPFFTTKPSGQGTGVGLAVVRRIVAEVGGFVRVETAVEHGSKFRLYLPMVSSW